MRILIQMRKALIRLAKSVFHFRPVEDLLRSKTIGVEYGTFISRLAPTHETYKKETLREVNLNGINFSLDISDLMGWFVYWGFAEAARTNLYALVNRNDTVLDVGANLGEVALNLAKIVGESGQVFAFEPFPATLAKLKKNCSLNFFQNIEIIENGLGDERSVFSMIEADQHNTGMNRISADEKSGKAATQIEVIKLDDFTVEKGLRKIDFIKIDVEGFEMKVLRGSERTLREFKPKLFIEIDDNNLKSQKSSAHELILFLENFSYSIKNAETLQNIRSTEDFTNKHFDIIALPVTQTL